MAGSMLQGQTFFGEVWLKLNQDHMMKQMKQRTDMQMCESRHYS